MMMVVTNTMRMTNTRSARYNFQRAAAAMMMMTLQTMMIKIIVMMIMIMANISHHYNHHILQECEICPPKGGGCNCRGRAFSNDSGLTWFKQKHI